jgi:hypothetical protein
MYEQKGEYNGESEDKKTYLVLMIREASDLVPRFIGDLIIGGQYGGHKYSISKEYFGATQQEIAEQITTEDITILLENNRLTGQPVAECVASLRADMLKKPDDIRARVVHKPLPSLEEKTGHERPAIPHLAGRSRSLTCQR